MQNQNDKINIFKLTSYLYTVYTYSSMSFASSLDYVAHMICKCAMNHVMLYCFKNNGKEEVFVVAKAKACFRLSHPWFTTNTSALSFQEQGHSSAWPWHNYQIHNTLHGYSISISRQCISNFIYYSNSFITISFLHWSQYHTILNSCSLKNI